ncbi:YozE family protein [Staphylococcus xylosus]|uniref:YozE family protein n=1 Tax=Staphylococcus xylosus TaxID=1288 RepID=UPI002DBCB433|nr:YozE family protein [Staphylococcus xylosus]MEB7812283.1 sterile alpha motif-like domain-containing protein [Staphylococcus xylosus]
MTFYDFVIDFIEDDTPLGQLAHNITGDKNFPKKETSFIVLNSYFYSNYFDHEVLASAKRALSLYRNNIELAN